MYDLPTDLAHDLLFHDPIYIAYERFIETFLKDWVVRQVVWCGLALWPAALPAAPLSAAHVADCTMAWTNASVGLRLEAVLRY